MLKEEECIMHGIFVAQHYLGGNYFGVWCNCGKLCMTIPIGTTACEQGFSCQNIIKNGIINGLSLKTLDALTFIYL